MGGKQSSTGSNATEYEPLNVEPYGHQRLKLVVRFNFGRGKMAETEFGRVKEVILSRFPNAEIVSQDISAQVKMEVYLEEVNDMKTLNKPCFGCSIYMFNLITEAPVRQRTEKQLVDNILSAVQHTEKEAKDSLVSALMDMEIANMMKE